MAIPPIPKPATNELTLNPKLERTKIKPIPQTKTCIPFFITVK